MNVLSVRAFALGGNTQLILEDLFKGFLEGVGRNCF